HAMRSGTLQDLQATGHMVLSAGLFGMFMVGFFSNRVGRRAALCGASVTVTAVLIWVLLGTPWSLEAWPALAQCIPDRFWIPVVSNICLPFLAIMFAHIFRDASVRSNSVYFRPCIEEAVRPD